MLFLPKFLPLSANYFKLSKKYTLVWLLRGKKISGTEKVIFKIIEGETIVLIQLEVSDDPSITNLLYLQSKDYLKSYGLLQYIE